MSNPNIYQPEAPQKSGCGGPCLKSCLGVAIVLVVLMIVAVVGLYWGAGRMVDAFLDTEPMELPEVQLSPAEKQDLENRIASFEETLEQPGELATLRLTGDEINAFVRDQLQDEELGRFSEYIYVTIEDGVIRSDISLPISELPIPLGIGSGRYLNGTATMRVVADDQEFGLYVENLRLKDQEMPEYYTSELYNMNQFDRFKDDPDFQEFRRAIETFHIEGDEIVISMRVSQEDMEESALPETQEIQEAPQATEPVEAEAGV